MKIVTLKLLPVLLLIFVFSLTALSCRSPGISSDSTNKDVINYREFAFSAENINLKTYTQGTVFVRGDIKKAGDRRIVITARIEIDAEDWGGISFNIPQGWKVDNIASDYPQGNNSPESYISTLQTGSENVEYQRIIEIGNTRHGAAQPQGGKGSVIIELIPESSNPKIPEIFKLLIGVGSQSDNILNPVHGTIDVPLNVDYQDSAR